MPPRACVFDLDGTLVDSLRDIAEALNECLTLLGLPSYPVERYRYMVGEGIPKLAQRAVGATHPHLVARLAELARARYRVRPLRHTRPYPGVQELIGRLRAAGIRLAVLSNKPHDMTRRMVATFWQDGEFDQVLGYIDEEHRKPSPHYLRRICEDLDIAPTETWMVGDTPTDVETAHRAGALAVGVTWGFRTRAELAGAGADFIVDSPDELG
ncbi:MAG: HAD family hydrolase [Phycisphaerae bacterium]|nr:HAD family hydrolase [Phycisphaerae bacterium]